MLETTKQGKVKRAMKSFQPWIKYVQLNLKSLRDLDKRPIQKIALFMNTYVYSQMMVTMSRVACIHV